MRKAILILVAATFVGCGSGSSTRPAPTQAVQMERCVGTHTSNTDDVQISAYNACAMYYGYPQKIHLMQHVGG